jgi:hypothetical protein
MDHQLVKAALRVLKGIYYGGRPSAEDLDLLRANARPEEDDLELEKLAATIIWRFAKREPSAKGNAR